MRRSRVMKRIKKASRNIIIFLLIFCTTVSGAAAVFIYLSTRNTLMDYVRIDMGQNKLNEVYEGHISCTAEFSEDALKSRIPVIGGIFFEGDLTGGCYFYDCVNLSLYINGRERGDFAIYDPKVSADSLSPDDEIVIKAEWKPTNPVETILVPVLFGCGISKLPQIYRTTVREEIERQGLTLKTPVELDVLGYIEENDLLYSKDNVYGDTLVLLKAFETEINGYTVKNDNELGRSFIVIDPEGNSSGDINIQVGYNLDIFFFDKGFTHKVIIKDDTSPYGFVIKKRDVYFTIE